MAFRNNMVPSFGFGGHIGGGAKGVATPIVSGRVTSFMPSPSIGTVTPTLGPSGVSGIPPVRTGAFSASFGPTALPVNNHQHQNLIGPNH